MILNPVPVAMKPIHTFNVTPSMPRRIEPLWRLAHNLRWAWHRETIDLFQRLDEDGWQRTGHNPIRVLLETGQDRLDAAAADDGFVAEMDRLVADLDAYLADPETWFHRRHGETGGLVAYFSAEFGVTEALSIFAGGLGVLAGDHLKSASDLGVPLVGVGLLYQQGYFRQYLNEAGWQGEGFEDSDFGALPISLERHQDGTPVTVEIAFPGRTVIAQVWRADVGRVRLFLMDTNVGANSPEDRDITDQLYGGGLEMRIKQEIVLGIGGFRALRALGLDPAVCHMNEGHSAFLALEWVRDFMSRHDVPFDIAREAAGGGLVFTTHTPVAAGHDYFPADLMQQYFRDYARELGLGWKDFLALGRQHAGDEAEPFAMTVLALRLAAATNGVSRLHGEVTREMWTGVWPGLPAREVPIGSVTNGVHFQSWIARSVRDLYDRYLGEGWHEPGEAEKWARVEEIPDAEIWRVHVERRQRLVEFARQRLRDQLARGNASPRELRAAERVLDPKVLTVGFARRFAPYKRATLLLRDPERLARIVADAERPVQFLFAGKAHPHDQAGKELIRQIVALSHEEPFRGRIVFLENYDLAVARYLVQGSDVWLNTPRRPLEASGTSGMKAAANGCLNLSTLDGWWAEAWDALNPGPVPIGWAIGRGETYRDVEEQEWLEAEALYALLEHDVTATFYERQEGMPTAWIARMKATIRNLCPFFNADRMVRDYAETYYLPALERGPRLRADGLARARALAEQRRRLYRHWGEIRVETVDATAADELRTDAELRVGTLVHLGALAPEDVTVELYLGRLDPRSEVIGGRGVVMEPAESLGGGRFRYIGATRPGPESGRYGYTVRVLPNGAERPTPFLPGLVAWAAGSG
jgi:glycogen phosphorylase